MGMRPATWWNRSHDVDLLVGTYKYGFANYVSIKEDQKTSWSEQMMATNSGEPVEKSDFPAPEHLTKRLKKLLTIALRCDRFEFEKVSIPDKTGINFQEKTFLTKIIADCGDEGAKIIRTKLTEKLGKPSEAPERVIEKFIH